MSKLLSNYIEEANPEIRKKIAQKARSYSNTVQNYIKRQRKNLKNMYGKASERAQKAINKTAEKTGEKAGEAIGKQVTQSDDFKRVAKEAGEAAKKVTSAGTEAEKAAKTVKNVTKGAVGVGAAVVAAKVIQAGRNEYRNRVMGQCARYTGRDSTICRISAAKYHQRFLNGKLSNCNKTSDPTKCRERITNAIQRAKKTEDKMVLKLR